MVSARINIPWHRSADYFNGAAWHKTIAQAGGGTLITQGSHFLDVVLWALQDTAASAMGYSRTPVFDVEVDTLTHGIVETTRGTLINISSSMVAATEQPATIEMYGERGTACYRNAGYFSSVKFVGVKVQKQLPPARGVHALQRSLSGFARWVLHDTPAYLTPLPQALPVLEAVDAIYRSSHTGKQESVQP
jgi:predicted dehydrogenase